MKTIIHVNWDRAEEVFGILVQAVKNKTYPYNRAELPQLAKNLPKSLVWGSYEHALFLFAVCYYMRGGIQSDTAILSMTSLYEKNRDIFFPQYFRNDTSEETTIEYIKTELHSARLNYAAIEVSRFWVLNAKKLNKFWDSDPRNLFKGTTTYDELCTRIMRKGKDSAEKSFGFYGFREKMVSMLTYFYMHAGIIDPFIFPLPIDFHVQRLLVSHGILSVEGKGIGDDHFSQELLRVARNVTDEYCKKHSIDTRHLCDGLWLLSNTLCNKHPGNRSLTPKRRGRASQIFSFSYGWTETHLIAYDKSCAHCPVEKTCQYHIPSAHYYISGKLIVRSLREKPKQLPLWPSALSTGQNELFGLQ